MAENSENNAGEGPQKYNPLVEEEKTQQFWEKEKIYSFNPKSDKKIFSIDTPPPTVSGKMHIGHAFSYAQQDFVARFKRMQGFEVFYPFGTDDNGLATNILVEKENKVKSSLMKRDEFVQLALKTLEKIRPEYIADWKRIGTSADFSIFYSTIDDHSRKISQKSFIDLYKDGRSYRKKAPVLWCPKCQTAIAQVEMEGVEHDSFFNDIIFKLQKENGTEEDLIIATTRPELLPACVAIFAHPEDERYKDKFGKKATVPLFGHSVPILPDEKADPEKGTGIVMCCTFGDQTDMEWYYKHNLPLKVAISKDGKMNGLAPGYEGMPIGDARKKIIEDLKNHRLLLTQKPIKHAVNVHERCATDVEILETEQWFIKYLDLKEKFMDAGAALTWHPQFMKVRFDNWIKGLQWDWCISRQRHFGIPFPVWYCKKCHEITLAAEKELPVDPMNSSPKNACACGSTDFEPEKDVLDTWATSSLSPQIAASLFPEIYDKLYPMDLRPQAHDIITFWLFNTLVKSQMHNGINPWKDIMISGFALDPKGKKMSKSKGNVIAPQAIISKYGADPLRFWAAGSKLGEDLPFQEKDLVTGNRMITKMWNASRFALMQLGEYSGEKPVSLHPVDKWILSKLNTIVKVCTENFEKYEYSKTKMEAERFFWHTLCDNYLELVKDRMYNQDNYGPDEVVSAKYTLYTSILTVLKLMAPIMPYITEAVYQLKFNDIEKVKSIHLTAWPEADSDLVDVESEKTGDLIVAIVEVVRKVKSQNNVSLKVPVTELTITCSKDEKKKVESLMDDLKTVINVEKVIFGAGGELGCEGSDIKVKVILGVAEKKK